MSKQTDQLKTDFESLIYIVGDALRAIRTLAELSMNECDRGPGRVSGRLVLDALKEISLRAIDAESYVDADAERHGYHDPAGTLQRLQRAQALNHSFGMPPT